MEVQITPEKVPIWKADHFGFAARLMVTHAEMNVLNRNGLWTTVVLSVEEIKNVKELAFLRNVLIKRLSVRTAAGQPLDRSVTLKDVYDGIVIVEDGITGIAQQLAQIVDANCKKIAFFVDVQSGRTRIEPTPSPPPLQGAPPNVLAPSAAKPLAEETFIQRVVLWLIRALWGAASIWIIVWMMERVGKSPTDERSAYRYILFFCWLMPVVLCVAYAGFIAGLNRAFGFTDRDLRPDPNIRPDKVVCRGWFWNSIFAVGRGVASCILIGALYYLVIGEVTGSAVNRLIAVMCVAALGLFVLDLALGKARLKRARTPPSWRR